MAEVRAGYPFRGPVEPFPEGSAGVVQMRDVAPDGSIHWEDIVRTELPGRRRPDWLRKGDLLLVTRGKKYYAACVDAVPDSVVCGPHLFHLRVKAGAAALPEFLAWQINQPPLQRALHAAAAGSSQRSVARPEVEVLPISLPSLATQERIVSLARLALRERDLFTSLIRNRERQLEILANNLSDAAAKSPA